MLLCLKSIPVSSLFFFLHMTPQLRDLLSVFVALPEEEVACSTSEQLSWVLLLGFVALLEAEVFCFTSEQLSWVLTDTNG
jgi:hypothetical protein